MVLVERLGALISPHKEYQATFNPGMIKTGSGIVMLYRFCEKKARWHHTPIDWSDLNDTPYEKDFICKAELTSS